MLLRIIVDQVRGTRGEELMRRARSSMYNYNYILLYFMCELNYKRNLFFAHIADPSTFL